MTDTTELIILPGVICDGISMYVERIGTGPAVLPPLPSTLESLQIMWAPITELPDLPPQLKCLHCVGTGVTQLPELPESLQHLRIDYMPVRHIPKLPPNLKSLFCRDCTELTHLPELPTSLKSLYCDSSYNPMNIDTLPVQLPPGLVHLAITNNKKISTLPAVLPVALKTLSFENTRIKKLPPLPPGLYSIDVNSRRMPSMMPGESLTPYTYEKRLRVKEAAVTAIESLFSQKRCVERCAAIKDELIEVTWHPDRIIDWYGVLPFWSF